MASFDRSCAKSSEATEDAMLSDRARMREEVPGGEKCRALRGEAEQEDFSG